MKDFLSIRDVDRPWIDRLLTLASELKGLQKRGEPHRRLPGKTLAMIFEKSSTRTRVSFEVGMTQLGGHALFLSSDDIQMGRGETVADTARVLSRYADGILIRTYSQETVEELARHASVPVINGLTDLLHPCQVLADVMTLAERFGSYEGLKVAYVGDGNNLAHSWIHAAAALGFELALACPDDELCRPREEIVAYGGERLGDRFMLTGDPNKAVEGAHAVYTDVWVSMGQEDSERKRRALSPFQVSLPLLEGARPEAVVMHCLPAHRGEEITEEAADSPRAVFFDQAENRLHLQKAVLVTLMGGR